MLFSGKLARPLACQVRWNRDPAWGDRMKAEKLKRVNALVDQQKRIRAPSSPALKDKLQGVKALDLLLERKAKSSVVELDSGRGEPDHDYDATEAPTEEQYLDEKPLKAFVVLHKGRERTKGTVVHKEEMSLAHSKPPEVGGSPSVQIRAASGDRILGYGLWKPAKSSVYVLLWVSPVRSRLSPNAPKAKSLESLSIGRRFWFHRFFKALEYRQSVLDLEECEAFRLINADADGCPGIITNLYSNAASITLTDSIAVSYLPYLLEYLETRTPTTVIHVSTTVSWKKMPQRLLGFIGDAPAGVTSRVIKEHGLILTVSLEQAKTLLQPAKRSFREAVARFVEKRRAAVVNDADGSLGAYALQAGVEKLMFIHHDADMAEAAKKNVKRNFFGSELQAAAVKQNRGFAHHVPSLEKRVAWTDSAVGSFFKKVDRRLFDCFVIDLATAQAEFQDPAWVHLILLSALRNLDTSQPTGAMLLFITLFDLREAQDILTSAVEKTNLDIRLVEPIYPAPDVSKSAFTYTRPEFTGWVVNVRRP
ncbi:Ribosomal RNA large subunit methyltransferase I [Diplonema papillatum]|nr:Ribosomal RNA large subunit methyltransferase I [Diplonema papillatum]